MNVMRGAFLVRGLVAAALAVGLFSASARAADKLLEATAEWAGAVLFLQTRVPGLVIGVVRNGETAVFGFGEASDGSGRTPDRDTILRVGSISKAFTGQVLASLAAGGTVELSDMLQDRLGWDITVRQAERPSNTTD